jgi:hypothetical protein
VDLFQYPEFRTAEVLSHEQMSTGIPAQDWVLAGFEVAMTHLFYGDSQVNEELLRFAVEARLPHLRMTLSALQ